MSTCSAIVNSHITVFQFFCNEKGTSCKYVLNKKCYSIFNGQTKRSLTRNVVVNNIYPGSIVPKSFSTLRVSKILDFSKFYLNYNSVVWLPRSLCIYYFLLGHLICVILNFAFFPFVST